MAEGAIVPWVRERRTKASTTSPVRFSSSQKAGPHISARQENCARVRMSTSASETGSDFGREPAVQRQDLHQGADHLDALRSRLQRNPQQLEARAAVLHALLEAAHVGEDLHARQQRRDLPLGIGHPAEQIGEELLGAADPSREVRAFGLQQRRPEGDLGLAVPDLRRQLPLGVAKQVGRGVVGGGFLGLQRGLEIQLGQREVLARAPQEMTAVEMRQGLEQGLGTAARLVLRLQGPAPRLVQLRLRVARQTR